MYYSDVHHNQQHHVSYATRGATSSSRVYIRVKTITFSLPRVNHVKCVVYSALRAQTNTHKHQKVRRREKVSSTAQTSKFVEERERQKISKSQKDMATFVSFFGMFMMNIICSLSLPSFPQSRCYTFLSP